MAIYRQVYMSFWTDTKVDDDFTPEDKYFYLYLITNPYTNICGCYEISIKQMSKQTGYNEDTVKRLIDRMKNVHGVVDYDYGTKEVLLINWHKYNWSKSADLMKNVDATINSIKSDAFKAYLMDLSEGVERVYRPSIDGRETSVTVTDTVTGSVISSNRNKKAFSPPSVDEVRAYCQERLNGIDAENFIDYYEARGWILTNKNKMVDWKAAVRTWEKNGYNRRKVTDWENA